MGRQRVNTAKAVLVFPELLSQEEIDKKPSRKSRVKMILDRWKELEAQTPLSRELPKPACPELEVRATNLSVRNLHEFGDLYPRYLEARRAVFIDQKGWQLPETEGMEFDQYDTPLARWIVIHNDADILASVRLMPTTATCGNHSYMLRDAQLGRLPGLPTDMLYDIAPVDREIWEATRLFINETVPLAHRMQVQKTLMREMVACAEAMQATHVIGIVPALFKRWLKRIGMTAEAVGPVKLIAGDKVQAALMTVPKSQTNNAPSETPTPKSSFREARRRLTG